MNLRKFIMFFSLVAIIVGILLIIGTKRRWKFLVDPSDKLSSIYSHSRIKKVFGKDFLEEYNYVVGILFILVGIWFLFIALFG
ncbi:hypothetical protein BBF96_08860 [Anoxybacter fermentans]|uniref:Uncharacterized protein n=1 Tax=Anoxybacter fermentans TaxID=1323375 RepID=A0A3Q9HQI8_9FIRM|nr:hypothetical protein [Anoxybacter fermentans]AZR73483.1 hypothetical protein BBF96_08860 [Anoxybacter fermentans]